MNQPCRRRWIVGLAIPSFLLFTAGTAAAAATTIGFGTAVSGTIGVAGEIDWYSVTSDTVGDLKVTQTAWPPYIETQIAVFGPDNQTQAQAHPVLAAAPGTYYIKVWSANNGVSETAYTFSVALTKADTGNDLDKGKNSASGAVPLTLGVAVSDTIAASKETAGVQDVDWFSVTTDTVGDLAVTQTVWPPYIETQIAVFGPNDATLAQGNPVTAAAPGTYYIKVWSANEGSSIAPYTFSATLTKATTGNDVDKGSNSAAGAVPIALGVAVSDTIAPSKATAGKQDVDWFTVVAPVTGELAVTQTAWPPFLETRIALFGPNDPALALGNPAPSAAPGTYYIKVWSAADGASITPYTFSATQKGAPISVPSDAGTASDANRGADAPVAVPTDGGRNDAAGLGDVRTVVGIDATGPRDAALGTDATVRAPLDGGVTKEAGTGYTADAPGSALDGGTHGGLSHDASANGIDAGGDGGDGGGCSSCSLAGRGAAAHFPAALFLLMAALIAIRRRR